MCHARVSGKGKFHHGISVLSPNPLLRVDTAGSFIPYPKMSFLHGCASSPHCHIPLQRWDISPCTELKLQDTVQ